MQADTIKLLFTYLIALVVIVGGGAMLYQLAVLGSENQQAVALSLAASGFIGMALNFVFGAEAATRATRAAQKQTQATVDAINNPPITPPPPEA